MFRRSGSLTASGTLRFTERQAVPFPNFFLQQAVRSNAICNPACRLGRVRASVRYRRCFFFFFGCKLVARRLNTTQKHFAKKEAHLVSYYLRISHSNNLLKEKCPFSSMCWSSVISFLKLSQACMSALVPVREYGQNFTSSRPPGNTC